MSAAAVYTEALQLHALPWSPLRYLWALAITLVYRSLLEVHIDFFAIILLVAGAYLVMHQL